MTIPFTKWRLPLLPMTLPFIDGACRGGGSKPMNGLFTTAVSEIGFAVDYDPHGAHCTKDQCIMYWLNESGSDLAGFISRNILSSRSILFHQDCLDDLAKAAA